MLKGTRHAIDFRGADAHLVGDVSPSCCCHFFDDLARWAQSEAEIARRFLEEINRASAIVEIDVGCQNPRLEVGGRRVEVVDRRE